MNELLHRYLDGEIPFEALPPALQTEALRWEARMRAARSEGPAGMPAGLTTRIQRSLPARARSRWRRASDWALRPRTLRVSPLGIGLIAAAAVILMLAPWRGPASSPVVASDTPVRLYVEFVMRAPGARSVAVAGDFTTWSPDVELQDVDGDGVWAGRVLVQPGMHRYMFVIDGTEWVTDPNAARHADDGFGNRNAVLVVPTLGI